MTPSPTRGSIGITLHKSALSIGFHLLVTHDMFSGRSHMGDMAPS